MLLIFWYLRSWKVLNFYPEIWVGAMHINMIELSYSAEAVHITLFRKCSVCGNLSVLVAISKGMRTLKLCSNKVLHQFLAGATDWHRLLYSGRGMAVCVGNVSELLVSLVCWGRDTCGHAVDIWTWSPSRLWRLQQVVLCRARPLPSADATSKTLHSQTGCFKWQFSMSAVACICIWVFVYTLCMQMCGVYESTPILSIQQLNVLLGTVPEGHYIQTCILRL